MNRQEQHAYKRGWNARITGEDFSTVTGPLRITKYGRVLPGESYLAAARRGWDDAVCECGHLVTAHVQDYGCQHVETTDHEHGAQTSDECSCVEFVSAAAQRRRERAMQRKRDQEFEAQVHPEQADEHAEVVILAAFRRPADD